MIIELLNPNHAHREFDCGRETLNDFLRSCARTYAAWDLGRTFVGVPGPGESRIIGYYTLQTAHVISPTLSDALGVDFVPVVLLDRLAVDKVFQGKGYGEQLLVDALVRAYRVSRDVGAHAVLIEALDDTARSLYVSYGFQTLDRDPLHLYMTMKHIRSAWPEMIEP